MKAIIFIIILSLFGTYTYSKEKADDKKTSINEITKDQYNDIMEFGTSNKRLWMIHEIAKKKDKEFYPFLKQILQKDENPDIQKLAIESISNLKIKEYAPQIHDLIQSENELIQASVIFALGELEFTKAEPEILKIFHTSKNDIVKRACIKTFGKLKTNKALSELYEVYKLPKISGDDKLSILMSIGMIGDASSLPFLQEILSKQQSPSLERAFSAGAIGQIGGPEAKKILKQFSHDKDKRVAMAVLKAFGEDKDTESYDIINRSLRNDDAEIRYSALESLEKNLTPKSFRILKYITFNDNHFNVRKKAVELLSKMGGPKVVEMWLDEMDKDKSGLKYEIVKASHHLDSEDAAKILVKAFKNEKNLKYKKFILQKMFEVNHKEAITVLKKNVMYKEDGIDLGLKLYAISLIHNKMKKEGIPHIEKYLRHDNLHIRRYAYFYILNLKDESVYKNIFKILKDENNEKVVIYVLGIFRDKEIKEALPLLKEFKYKSHLVSKELSEVISELEKK